MAKYINIRFLFFNILTFISLLSFSQNALNENRFFIVKFGNGVNYGGYGINTEFRQNRVGGYFNFGYAPENETLSKIIPSSYNVGGGLNYYFLDAGSTTRPRLGIYYGWLNNYYKETIGTAPYNPTVYGLALMPGFEFGEKIVYFDINLVIDPGVFIYNKNSHPFYSSSFYFSTSFGLGINLYQFNKAVKRLRTVKKNDSKKNDIDHEHQEDNVIPEEEQIIEETCFNSSNYVKDISKGLCHENIVFQQISSDKYVVVKFERNITDYSGTNVFNAEDDLFAHVYIVENNKTDNFCHILEKNKKIIKASEGKIILNVKENLVTETFKISVMLKNVIFKTSSGNVSNEQIYDEIIICNLEY